MIVVTSGEKYVDIDALACAVAYQELLNLEGKDSVVVFPGILNHSISPIVKKQSYSVEKKIPEQVDGYVVVDVSEPDHVASFVIPEKVKEIYDHHYGFRNFWEEKIGLENVHIEMIGACATLIWEAFKKRDKDQQISTSSANLLSFAIISNTFNLTSPLTHQKDVSAFNELEQYTDLPSNWKEVYYNEQEQFIYENPIKAVTDDTKIQDIPQLKQSLVIGQIELWDGSNFIEEHLEDIQTSLRQHNNPCWMINIPSISEGKNYIYSENSTVKELIEDVTNCSFEGNTCVTDRLILRKEILKGLYNS
ncbi:MAG: hypothetical protein WD579_03065 [Candidatus Paceibacterota bacterium]